MLWRRDKSPVTEAVWTGHSVCILDTILTTLAWFPCYTYTNQLDNGNIITEFSYGEVGSCNENIRQEKTKYCILLTYKADGGEVRFSPQKGSWYSTDMSLVSPIAGLSTAIRRKPAPRLVIYMISSFRHFLYVVCNLSGCSPACGV
jgi:hypothetical protein